MSRDFIIIRQERDDFRIRPLAIILDPSAFKSLSPDGKPCVIGYNHGAALLSVPLEQENVNLALKAVDYSTPADAVRDSKAPMWYVCDQDSQTIDDLIAAHMKYDDDAYRGSWQQAELRAFQELKQLRENIHATT